ncbi:MAG: LytS/YhcK type 5TM receptor domain-containing protein [Candidatus Sericytochromatia bacterium]|nr:LytS/YhcK type 5TM receptor domain-containing protein [Candidatus Sericytochromatia bacterium]
MTLLRALWLLLPLALVWESSELAVLPYLAWRLDPVLALVVLAGLTLGPRHGVWLGLVGGGCQDLLVGAGLLYGGTKALAGAVAGLVQPHVYRLDALSLAVVGLLASLGEGLTIALYLFAQGRTAVWDHFASLSLPVGLVNAALLVLVHAGVTRLPASEARKG